MGFFDIFKTKSKTPKKNKPITELQIEIAHLPPEEVEQNKFMEMATFSQIAQYFDLAKIVKFSGWGDPLAHPQALEMIKIAKEKVNRVQIVTDGKFLTPALCQELVNLGIEKLTLKLNPPHNTLNHINKSLQTLMKLRKDEPEIFIDYKMTIENIHQLPQVLESAGNLNINEFSISNIDFIFNEHLNNSKVFEGVVSDENRGDLIKQGKAKGNIEYEGIIKQSEKIANRQGISFSPTTLVPKEAIVCEYNPLNNIFVTWEGLLAPCPFLALNNVSYYFSEQKEEQHPYIIGDLKTTELSQLWEDNEYYQFRKHYCQRNQLFNKYMEETFDGEPNAQLLASNYEKLDRQLLENKVPSICSKCYKTYSI